MNNLWKVKELNGYHGPKSIKGMSNFDRLKPDLTGLNQFRPVLTAAPVKTVLTTKFSNPETDNSCKFYLQVFMNLIGRPCRTKY